MDYTPVRVKPDGTIVYPIFGGWEVNVQHFGIEWLEWSVVEDE